MDTDWSVSPPADGNFPFEDFVIDIGATLTVPSGTVIRCSRDFINEGQIIVDPGMPGERWFGNADPFPALAGNAMTPAQGGGGLAFPSSRLRHVLEPGLFSGSNGGRGNGSPDNDGGAGGGSLVIRAGERIVNFGSIHANGGNGLPGDGGDDGGGGGGGGFLVLASDGDIDNSGVISANGGNGVSGLAGDDGGGGGGGVIHLVSPNASSVGDLLDVSGGSSGATVCTCCGGSAGGAMAGHGGAGSDNGVSASSGQAGVVIRTEVPAASPLLLR